MSVADPGPVGGDTDPVTNAMSRRQAMSWRQTMSWRQAMRIAADLDPAPPIRVGLDSALGTVLAQPVVAQADLPPVSAAAAPGYAVRGIGPWSVCPTGGQTLDDGTAVVVRAGDPVPPGAHAVLPDNRAIIEHTAGADIVRVGDPDTSIPDRRPGMVVPGTGILVPGAEAHAADLLLKPGATVTAGTVALAAAAGMDELIVTPPATVTPVLLGSDLLASGPPRRGRGRDIIAPLLPGWVMGSAGRCLPAIEGRAGARELAHQLEALGTDLTVLTATAEPGIGSAVTEAVSHLGAEILVDRLAAAPADQVLLAELRDGRRLLALPREPAAAVVVLALLLTPMMAALSGRGMQRSATVMLRDGVTVSRHERAVAVQIEVGELADLASVEPWSGPHGLGAVGAADAIAFIDPGRGRRGDSVPAIGLPGRC